MLDNDKYYSEHSSIYPGKYEQMPWKEKELTEELCTKGRKIVKPPVNITELSNHYLIEMAVPGFSREDFIIHTERRLLSIAAVHKNPSNKKDSHYRLLSFNCKCIKHEVSLPYNVDPDFVTAEYINGILQICLFKTKYPGESRHCDIIVY
jgi:HSP20 family protein